MVNSHHSSDFLKALLKHPHGSASIVNLALALMQTLQRPICAVYLSRAPASTVEQWLGGG